MPGRDFLLIADAVAPLGDGVSALGAAGLSRALAALGHRTTVLTLASADAASRVPGLARRLRTVSATVGNRTHDLTLFEGRALLSDAQLMVLAATPSSRAETAALLAAAVRSLANDKLVAPEVTIGWGEPAAAALSATSAAVRLFVLPTGRLGPSLAPPEAEVLGPLLLGDESASHSLVALGCLGANAIVAPSPSAARATASDPGLASRASDEPVIAVRFGCDDPPNDPASDPALPANFSATALSGKTDCRRAIARRCSIALGPRTLLLTTGPLHRDGGADAILGGIERLAPFDVATIIVPRGDAEMIERARLLALKQPGRIALFPGADAVDERLARGAADAILLGDDHDRIGRAAGLALLYGTLPIAPEVGANSDYLVDYDARSRTGHAIVYSAAAPFEVESAVRRALTLRSDGDVWTQLVKTLMTSAPRWSAAAASIAEVATQYLDGTAATTA
jgi:starch synthase